MEFCYGETVSMLLNTLKLIRPIDIQTTVLSDRDRRPGGRRTGSAPFFDEAGRLIKKSPPWHSSPFKIGLECFLW